MGMECARLVDEYTMRGRLGLRANVSLQVPFLFVKMPAVSGWLQLPTLDVFNHLSIACCAQSWRKGSSCRLERHGDRAVADHVSMGKCNWMLRRRLGLPLKMRSGYCRCEVGIEDEGSCLFIMMP